MTAVVAVKHPDPIFEGQTKTKLASADAAKAVIVHLRRGAAAVSSTGIWRF